MTASIHIAGCSLLPVRNEIDNPFDLPDPLEVPEEDDEPSDLDEYNLPCTDEDWDVFLADEDEEDPLPEPGDFWANDEFPNDE